MSLILDALRKSEAERRRGQSPDLYATTPVAVAGTAPSWLRWWPLPVVLVGLVMAVVFLLPMLDRDTPRDADPARTTVVDAQVSSGFAQGPRDGQAGMTRPTPSRATPLDAIPGSDAAAAAATSEAAASSAPIQAPTPVSPSASADRVGEGNANVAATPTLPSPVAPANVAGTQATVPSKAAQETLPPLSMLGAGERAALPPLKLSMHVWASEPARRFAIVDGKRITEGALVGAAVVAEIRQDGVVLELDGRRFLLPRP